MLRGADMHAASVDHTVQVLGKEIRAGTESTLGAASTFF